MKERKMGLILWWMRWEIVCVKRRECGKCSDEKKLKPDMDMPVTHRTIASIFFLYFWSISFRYSGLISIAAKLKAEFFRPARWHSMTADVRMGTTSAHRHVIFQIQSHLRGFHVLFRLNEFLEEGKSSSLTHVQETCWYCCWHEWACVPLSDGLLSSHGSTSTSRVYIKKLNSLTFKHSCHCFDCSNLLLVWVQSYNSLFPELTHCRCVTTYTNLDQ